MFLKGDVNFNATCSQSHSDIVKDERKCKGSNIARIKAKLKKEGAFDLSPQEKAKKRLHTISEGSGVDKSISWHGQLEFIVYCIATAIGLGNDMWRFPFVAYKNGGGAFLIPYLLLLVLVGGPLFFLETFLGQFSSSNCVKMWDMVPALRGGGLAQALGTFYILSYYMSMIAISLFYLYKSFDNPLPWAYCDEEWINCVGSGQRAKIANSTSSAEFYFRKAVLHQKDGIDDGIGAPILSLSICLLISWIFVYIAVAKGVKDKGWLSYSWAVLPYVILSILFVRAVTLPGAKNGIVVLFKPQWVKIFDIKVWYAATAQIFFSLSLCSGTISMFASFNSFRLDVYRDAMVVTSLDSFTSLISGVTMFGILGNLAHELGHDTIDRVVGSGGVGLTFISYPDAIAKFPFAPQAFAVLFFVMTAVLGVGTGVLMFSSIIVVVKECFPRVGTFYLTTIGCVFGFCTGLPYVTPGGQYITELVDYYGGIFVRLFSAIIETVGVFWIYGLEKVCLDVEYVLGKKCGIILRICWGLLIPLILFTVFIYSMMTEENLEYGDDYIYPNTAYIAGYMLQYNAILIVLLTMLVVLFRCRTGNFIETVNSAFHQLPTYGPANKVDFDEWKAFHLAAKAERHKQGKNWIHHIMLSLFGGYHRPRKEPDTSQPA